MTRATQKIEDLVEELSKTDFTKYALSIGVYRPECKSTPWMELDADDWRLLYLSLMKKLPGCDSSAAEASWSLGQLAAFAMAAEGFMRRQSQKSPLDSK
jgi:hypothetical protein